LNDAPTWWLPEEYVLRTYRAGDQDEHIRVMRKAGFKNWSAKSIEESLPRCLPDGFFVVEHKADARLVATAMASHNPLEHHPSGGELGWVAADPEHRGKGLGYCVCAAVTARFLQAGYKNLFLRTDDFRLPAIKTYLKLGWIPFLFAPDMQQRWISVCSKLGIDFDGIGRVMVPFSPGT
jgi:mycothiol synthase